MTMPRFAEYAKIQREIQDLIERKNSLYSLKAEIIGRMPKGKGQGRDEIANTVTAIEETDNKICRKIAKLNAIGSQVEEAIEGLTSDKRLLMRLKYYDCLSHEKIGEVMGYSKSTVDHKHRAVIAELERKYGQ